MDKETFIKHINRNHSDLIDLFMKKNLEYSGTDDVFKSFKESFSIHETPTARAWELLSKHLISIKKIIKAREEGVVPPPHVIKEKFTDAQVYLHLIEAMLSYDRDRLNIKDCINDEKTT